MGTNPTLEGDGTALYISNLLGPDSIPMTRLARGITTGSVLEFANKEILADALAGRQKILTDNFGAKISFCRKMRVNPSSARRSQ